MMIGGVYDIKAASFSIDFALDYGWLRHAQS